MVKQFFQHYPVVAFEFFAVGITWLLVLPLVVAEYNPGSSFVLPYHHYLGALGPIAAAVLVTYISTGKKGLKKYAATFFAWSVPAKWYLFAVGCPFLVLLFVLAGIRLISGSFPPLWQFATFQDLGQVGIVLGFILHTLTFGLGEEAGWRGYVLPKLQRKYAPVKATAVLSFLWAIWHVPMLLYRSGFSAMGPGELLGWFLSLCMGAVVLTWLYNKSKSVLIPVLFHGTINTIFTMQATQGMVTNILGASIMVWAVVLLVKKQV